MKQALKTERKQIKQERKELEADDEEDLRSVWQLTLL
jgi:hypothetical protein